MHIMMEVFQSDTGANWKSSQWSKLGQFDKKTIKQHWIITQSGKWISMRPYGYKTRSNKLTNVSKQINHLSCVIPNNFRSCILKERNLTLDFLTGGALNDFLPKRAVWSLSQWPREASSAISLADSVRPWYDVMRMALYLCGLSLSRP